MAMNKKEKAYVATLEEYLRENKALLSASVNQGQPKPLPDVPPPDTFQGLTKGYMYNAYARTVNRACSSSVSHSSHRDDKTNSQRPMHLYSTEALALKAMRYDVEQMWLKEIAKIDKQLKELENKANT